ncbi:MAG TPA: Ger(x)C family spore germination protein [Bacillota bacterium]|nr:Ger(x)C family spore germination protein [Bacillota bacterium]
MARVMRLKFLIIILLIVSFCPGCWDVEEVNRRATGSVLFLDTVASGKVRMGMSFPMPGTQLPPYGATEQEFFKRHFVVEAEGRGVLDVLKELQVKTMRTVDFGSLQAVIFTERYLSQGRLGDLYDFVDRSIAINENAVLFLCKSDPAALLAMKLNNNTTPGSYIATYFQSHYKHGLVTMAKLWKVSSDEINGDSDVFLPYIELADGQYRIAGTGLFSQERYQGELDIDETQFLMMMRGQGPGYLTIPLNTGGDSLIAFSNLISAVKIKPQMGRDGKALLAISMNVTGWLQEMKPRRVNLTPGELKAFNVKTQAFIRQKIVSLLRKLQKLNSDPVGFGEKVRARDPDFAEKHNWHRVYQKATFQVKVKFTLVNTGRRG